MIDTKLILIEGLPGSGKSTTAERLAAELREHGKSCRWFHEWAEDHPVFIGYEKDISEIISSSRLREKPFVKQWEVFAKEAQSGITVNIIESRFWQTGVMLMYSAGYSEDEVVEINQLIITVIAALKPALIYFTHDDIEKALTWTMQVKNEEWEKTGRGKAAWERFFTGILEQQKWATDRGLKGREMWFRFFEEWDLVAERLYDRLTFPKIKIRNPHSDWDMAMRRIREFVGLVW
jgi:thymidylate kinase